MTITLTLNKTAQVHIIVQQMHKMYPSSKDKLCTAKSRIAASSHRHPEEMLRRTITL